MWGTPCMMYGVLDKKVSYLCGPLRIHICMNFEQLKIKNWHPLNHCGLFQATKSLHLPTLWGAWQKGVHYCYLIFFHAHDSIQNMHNRVESFLKEHSFILVHTDQFLITTLKNFMWVFNCNYVTVLIFF